MFLSHKAQSEFIGLLSPSKRRRARRNKTRREQPHGCRLALEPLEERRMLSMILWDDAHDTNGDELSGNYSEFRDLVIAADHTITELDGSPGAITPAVLAGIDVLMIFDAESSFTASEFTAIQNFVSGNGHLFVAGEHASAFARSSHNTLLAPYGIQFLSSPSSIDDLNFFNPDPLTVGLASVEYSSGGALNVTGPGTKILGRTSATGHIGYAIDSNNRVLVLSDSDALKNTYIAPGNDNERLVVNMLEEFIEIDPPPTELGIDLNGSDDPGIDFVVPNPGYIEDSIPISIVDTDLTVTAGGGDCGSSVTIDFSSGSYSDRSPSGLLNDIYTEDGFTFQTQNSANHVDGSMADGVFTFHDGSINTSPNIIDVDMGGSPFGLTSFDVVNLTAGLPITFTNSVGETFAASTLGTITPPAGQNWSNITSFTMRANTNNDPVFLDNFVFAVGGVGGGGGTETLFSDMLAGSSLAFSR